VQLQQWLEVFRHSIPTFSAHCLTDATVAAAEREVGGGGALVQPALPLRPAPIADAASRRLGRALPPLHTCTSARARRSARSSLPGASTPCWTRWAGSPTRLWLAT
jgi:hypothetical protein